MTPASLKQWIEHPEVLNRDTLYELRTLVARYPYFQSLRLLYLKNLYLLHDSDFGMELRKAVPYIADRRVLFYLIEGDRYELKREESPLSAPLEMVEEPGMDRTLALIDAFLSTMPEGREQPAELDYAMDYTAYLLSEEDNPGEPVAAAVQSENAATEETPLPKLHGQELIDDFIRHSDDSLPLASSPDLAVEKDTDVKIPENVSEEEEEEEKSALNVDEPLEEDYFTETLAKIYIKQRRYDKALEIIKKLSLNYPKKNAYFADQIRFLEKLIINAKTK